MPDPLYQWAPPYVESDGDLAVDLAAQVGMVMDPEQVDILRDVFAEDEPGIPTCFEVAVVGPRQNIKTSTLEIAALTDVFVFEHPLHVWTAHLYSTTQKSFEHMVELVGGCEDLRRRCVWPPRTAHGEQAIELLTGQKIEFRARSTGGGRGFTGVSRVTFDEALFLSGAMMGALLPTMATIRGAQVRYGSSAGFVFSDALRSLRDRGRPGGDPRLAYREFGAAPTRCAAEDCQHIAPGKAGHVPGCALDREELWEQANTALHRRIHIDLMRSFRRALPPEEFSREFLSWWEDPPPEEAPDAVFPDIALWTDRRDPASRPLDPVAVGLDVSPKGVAALSVAGWRADGRMHGELIRAVPTRLVVPLLTAVVAAADPATLVLDPAGPAGSLLPDIRAAGLDPRLLSAVERGQADAGLARDVAEDRMRLPGEPMPVMDGAAQAATWRDIGTTGAKAFDRRAGGAGISPLVSLSLARFGLLEVAASPPKGPPPEPRAVRSGDTPAAAGDIAELATVGF